MTKQSKGKGKEKASEQSLPSANWLALQKKLKNDTKTTSRLPSKKRRRMESVADDVTSEAGSSPRESVSVSSFPQGRDSPSPHRAVASGADPQSLKHGRESLAYLRKLVFGELGYSEEQKQPGKYLAIDCEMVGVGPNGSESSLARVSLVNYYGAVILDEFVRQRERVTDYRTFVSGIRASDMVKAIPFADVQKRVDDLLKDRILVGHALNNDLKALLLSHPRNIIRDTQLLAGKARLLKTKYPALRKLAHQELGIIIQAGEHSSVTDARATMALYRLHRKEWEKQFRTIYGITSSSKSLGKRKAPVEDDDSSHGRESSVTTVKTSKRKGQMAVIPGSGKKGISSGISTVVKRAGQKIKIGRFAPEAPKEGGEKTSWWSTLDGVAPCSTPDLQ
ncbi:REX4 [Sanghuangporus weigelae]